MITIGGDLYEVLLSELRNALSQVNSSASAWFKANNLAALNLIETISAAR